MATVILDAGHGGWDRGATYDFHVEKDDNLELALAVGEILSQNGVNVLYTRVTDLYEAPIQKARDANNSGADYMISLHRNSSPVPNQYAGVESFVYSLDGVATRMAANINAQLAQVGYNNLGVKERTNLIVLNSTNIPAILVEVGFINSDEDNYLFEVFFEQTAQAIATGILESL
ncbi:MAG: N-acetylmuramoyl-L-alanine amidase [Lachnospiraceae bacterium]|nr:N-acetylmuramoyl-L-alanine amidase [Lachnospiraceae bacterium]